MADLREYDNNDGYLADDELAAIMRDVANGKISVNPSFDNQVINNIDSSAMTCSLSQILGPNNPAITTVAAVMNGFMRQEYNRSDSLRSAFPNGIEADFDGDEFCNIMNAPRTPNNDGMTRT